MWGLGSSRDVGTRSYMVHSTLKIYFKNYTANNNNNNTDSLVNSLSIFWKQMPPTKTFTRYTSDEHLYEQLSSKAVKTLGSHHIPVSEEALWFPNAVLIIDWDFSMALFQVFQVAYVIIKAANALGLETGSWNVLWMVWSSAPGSTMRSVTQNVWRITTSLRDRGPPTYRADDRSHLHLLLLQTGAAWARRWRPLPAGRSVFPPPNDNTAVVGPKWRIQIDPSWCRLQRSLTVEMLELRYHCLLLMLHVAPDTCYFIDFFWFQEGPSTSLCCDLIIH